jgi:uncharacterized protein YfaS (alpha-2-macroglobulin family)
LGVSARGSERVTGAGRLAPVGTSRESDNPVGIGYIIRAVETGAAPVPTATVFPMPRPQTVRCTAHWKVSLRIGL